MAYPALWSGSLVILADLDMVFRCSAGRGCKCYGSTCVPEGGAVRRDGGFLEEGGGMCRCQGAHDTLTLRPSPQLEDQHEGTMHLPGPTSGSWDMEAEEVATPCYLLSAPRASCCLPQEVGCSGLAHGPGGVLPFHS